MSDGARLRLAMAGLHPDRVRDLVATYGSAAKVLRAIDRGRVEVSKRAVAALHQSETQMRETLTELGVRPLWHNGDGYPAHLAWLPDAPDVLFVRGHLPDLPAVAVVGTRRCTTYGRSLARAYGSAIAEAGWVTVSGLARGIDAEAHRGTLAAGGAGIAVLGSGSNVIYPSEHRGLHDALVSGGGAIVTEYPPGTPPEAWRFPPRNRIISGLAACVVVVEAAIKGGALITATCAIDQAKPVLAVPGDIDRAASEGCNLLIRDGAIPVLGPDDLIEALSFVVGPPRAMESDIEDEESVVLGALGDSGASLESVVETTGLSAPEVLSEIARLEVSGAVVRVGHTFARVPGR